VNAFQDLATRRAHHSDSTVSSLRRESAVSYIGLFVGFEVSGRKNPVNLFYRLTRGDSTKNVSSAVQQKTAESSNRTPQETNRLPVCQLHDYQLSFFVSLYLRCQLSSCRRTFRPARNGKLSQVGIAGEQRRRLRSIPPVSVPEVYSVSVPIFRLFSDQVFRTLALILKRNLICINFLFTQYSMHFKYLTTRDKDAVAETV
jgi:hypothetical protein